MGEHRIRKAHCRTGNGTIYHIRQGRLAQLGYPDHNGIINDDGDKESHKGIADVLHGGMNLFSAQHCLNLGKCLLCALIISSLCGIHVNVIRDVIALGRGESALRISQSVDVVVFIVHQIDHRR